MCVYACMFVFLWYCVFVVRVDVGVLSQDTARCRQIPFVFVLIGHCGTVSCRQFQSTSQDTARCQWIPVVFVLIGHCGTVSCRQFQSTSQDSVVSGDPICVCVDWSLWDSERLAIPVYITGQRGVSRSHLCLC